MHADLHALRRPTVAALLSALALAGCGSAAGSAPSDRAVGDDAVTTAPADDAAAAAPDADDRATFQKVNANEASEDEIAAALEAAGIDNAEKWAHEVEEYRPYDPEDPTFAHLREELEKYDPDPRTLDAIISSLEL